MKNSKQLTYKSTLIWMSGQDKKMSKKGYFQTGYDVSMHHLFVTNGFYGFSIGCEPWDETERANKNVPIDVEALSIGMVRVGKSDKPIPNYDKVLNLAEDGLPNIDYWEQFSTGFHFDPSEKESKERVIMSFYVKHRIPISLHFLQNLPDVPDWEMYHYKSDDPMQVITHAVLFHTTIEGRNAYYIVMPMMIEDFDPSILPECIKNTQKESVNDEN